MTYQTYTLSNGLRIIHKPDESAVTYCGMVINTGSRDEVETEQGMAHFIEHMLFKGTEKRRSGHIINRLENVGGELNAYTSKEETVVYAIVLKEYFERAIELVSDIVLHSTFPQKEIDKEVVIIVDEIQSYNDSPSELIYDDFEELLFANHPIGHNILGKSELLEKYTTEDATRFVQKHYRPEEMVFFVLGDLDFNQIVRWAQKYLKTDGQEQRCTERKSPTSYRPVKKEIVKNTHQVHFMLGNRSYDLHHPNRMGMYLLNNILGGPGMNSLLNLSLREKHGLVYNVESSYQPFTDTGMWSVYFGCDTENAARCEQLVYSELQKLREQPLTENALKKYKLQLMGQMAISAEQKENLALSLGKSFLRYGKIDNLEIVKQKIEEITVDKLQEIANEIFNPDRLSVLKYV
ncbi:peptidase M16 domain protein [Paludibacter propionicigenes WB4]|uniref:Peptidase M16 domain protein n=1 Tax=Paludibacter propionicigenes (strain DSM 17365 / JCM 13257 / WB4) TaxID=694427 RepID=E4T3X8_PALPW|nr:pitrilysin family protein [Paludibacter propionicigenes]ADQ79422.1 peptidase M16 domain protein [Paludibacter propionicigenes WB4]